MIQPTVLRICTSLTVNWEKRGTRDIRDHAGAHPTATRVCQIPLENERVLESPHRSSEQHLPKDQAAMSLLLLPFSLLRLSSLPRVERKDGPLCPHSPGTQSRGRGRRHSPTDAEALWFDCLWGPTKRG